MEYVYFASAGSATGLAERLSEHFGGKILPLSQTRSAFSLADVMVFVVPAGVAVRQIAPLVQTGLPDPAVLLLDAEGQFVVPLLSGHRGTATAVATAVADFLGARAVLTAVQDPGLVLSFQEIAEENSLTMENAHAAKKLRDLMMQGVRMEIHTDQEVEWRNPSADTDSIRLLTYDAGDPRPIRNGYRMCAAEDTPSVFLTSRNLTSKENSSSPQNILILRPQDIVVGITCRSRSNSDYVYDAFRSVLERQEIPESSVACLATSGLKAEEPALRDLATRLRIPLVEVDAEAIRKSKYSFTESPFDQKNGAADVSAPCAYVASDKGRMLLLRSSFPGGVTIAIARKRGKIFL